VGRYRGLTNVLHWHRECELIRVVQGSAEIKIDGELFEAVAGDCFFCSTEQAHYIVGSRESIIDVIIFHTSVLASITEKYMLQSPRLTDIENIAAAVENIRNIITRKPRFYAKTLESHAQVLVVSIFNNNPVCSTENPKQEGMHIINKIHKDFATVTFDEAVSFSGYSPSYFSRTFKKLTGMTFSSYLNYIKIEHAVFLIQNNPDTSVTDIAFACGFSTIRNFNRVFKSITGFTPGTLPSDYSSQISRYTEDTFDPTDNSSTLLISFDT